MKRYTSLFALAARASFVKVVAVTLLTAILCGVLLWFAPAYDGENVYDETGRFIETVSNGTLHPEQMVKKSFCSLAALLGFAGVTYFLARTGTGKGGQPGYTAYRLRIKPRAITLLWTLYDFIMLLFYRAMMALTIYGVIGLRIREVGPQALLLCSYGIPFLHNLLPLRDIAAWAMLFSLTVLGAVGCACTSAHQWRGLTNVTLPYISAVILTGISMSIPAGNGASVLMAAAALLVSGALLHTAFKEDENETDQ